MRAVDLEAVRYDDRGLVPTVVQDARDGAVLMLGFMNAEALARTLADGDIWFWSRSRGALWHKGETSGNYLRLVEARLDCDGDAILLRALPEGPTCHTGERSCFSAQLPASTVRAELPPTGAAVIDALFAVVEERKRSPEPGSYTNHLLKEGVDRIGRKIGEEAAEVIIAAKNGSHEELAREMADLLYHGLVLLSAQGVTLDDVCAELANRVGAPRRHKE
jgi:phosphoribosyl-ATP pyrophosphohydrolase/phosphoribosyl-AMP cyclohydrolase